MSILYLIFHICTAVAFQQLLRYSQKYGSRRWRVITVNYIAAAVINILLLISARGIPSGLLPWQIIIAGIAAGTIYVVHMGVLLQCFKYVGVGLTIVIMSMSLIVPVTVSRVLWNEPVSVLQWMAIALMPAAILLIRSDHGGIKGFNWKRDAILILTFVLPGIAGTLHKSIGMSDLPKALPQYQTVLFATAALWTIVLSFYRRARPGKQELTAGIIIGALNVTATLTLLLALSGLAAVIVFPTAATMCIVLNLIISFFLWNEKIRRKQFIGIILAIIIVAIVNLG
jgi:drug/metabolite transporter (DMT)-like permease